jgi:hypothetical protein
MLNGHELKKMAEPVSHRSTTYPCFLPDLGGFGRSWSHRLADAKVRNFLRFVKEARTLMSGQMQ